MWTTRASPAPRWNNLTGGDKQGASTITQQYARNAYDNLKDDTYARKVKEAILASKLNDEYTKPRSCSTTST